MAESVPQISSRASGQNGLSVAWPLWLVLIAMVALGAYANSFRNGFAFDDLAIVRDNPHVNNLEWTSIWFDNYWASNDGIKPDILYRPLTLWSYLANEAISPGNSLHFHLVNVLLNALASVLVAELAWRLLADRRIGLVAGLLFAVHPLHTEVVANTVGRAELLAAVWSLLALLVFLPRVPLKESRSPERRPWWHGWLVAACFFAAILSKETPVTLLGAVVFIDLWRWSQWQPGKRPGLFRWIGTQTWRYYVPLGLAFGFYLAMRIQGPGLMTAAATVHPVVNLLVKATLAERIVTPFLLLGKYLVLMVWPVNLSADYSAPSIVPTSNLIGTGTVPPVLGMLICLLLGVFCLRLWKRSPQFLLLSGLFLLAYFLVANVVRIGTIFAERLFYWPSAFVLILIAWGAVRLCEAAAGAADEYAAFPRRHDAVPEALAAGQVPVLEYAPRPMYSRPRRIIAYGSGAALLVALIIGMSWRTWVRNTDWHDNITLAIATGRDNPESAKALHWAGTVLVLADNQRFQEVGLDLLDRSVEQYPELAGSYWELAKYHGRKNDLGLSLVYLSRAVRLDPGTRDTNVATHAIVEDLKRAKPETYMPAVEKFHAENPDLPETFYALALAYHGQKKYDLAEKYASEAIERGKGKDPGGRDAFHEAAAELAAIRFENGQKDQAVFLYRQYIIHMRNSVYGRCTMATLLMGADLKRHPEWLAEAGMNIERAELLAPGDNHVRQVKGDLCRAQWALAKGLSVGPAVALPNEGGATESIKPREAP